MFKPCKPEDGSRDRYTNIRPYSHNIIRSKSKTGHKNCIFRIFCICFIFIGNPPSNYINASWIKFPKDQMKYIATQAPLRKHDDISGIETFWEMILNKKVTKMYSLCCFKSSLWSDLIMLFIACFTYILSTHLLSLVETFAEEN